MISGPDKPLANASIPWDEDEQELTLVRRFEKVVTLCGHSTAVADMNHELSFQDIRTISYKTASWLLSQSGFIPRTAVGILTGPSYHRITGMLAATLAGSPFVPLDIASPRERILRIIQSCGIRMILADSGTGPLATGIAGKKVSVLILDEMKRGEPELVSSTNYGHDPLVILFTSGSEGQPKGVVHSQRSVLHEAKTSAQSLGLVPGDRMVQVSAMGSVASLSQTFTALLNGVVSMPFSLRNQGFNTLGRWIKDRQATVWSSSPTIFRNLCSYFPAGSFPSLRRVRLGGEQVHRSDLELCRDYCAKEVMVQVAYGTTETGIIASRNYMLSDLSTLNDKIPVGRAAGRKRIFLFDGENFHLRMDEPGEIAVTGDGLALEYHGDQYLTANKFREEDLSGSGKLRLYLTGDLGRMDDTGVLHFAGRKDDQITIRGFRVEPGEIEAAVMAWPGIIKCAVVQVRNPEGDKLTAFLSGAFDCVADSGKLRRFLAEKLPWYMIPEQFYNLNVFPENLHGKVDRKALANRVPDGDISAVTPGKPDPAKAGVLGVWRNLLKSDLLNVTDHFFEAGGDSLQMLQMVEILRQQLGIHVNIARFIERPVIDSMAWWQNNDGDVSAVECLNESLPLSVMLEQQKNMVRSWYGTRCSSYSLITGHHTTGKKTPLFWCFQGFEEMKALSAALGNDQPLYGMRSGHLIVKPDSPGLADMAAVYAGEILRLISGSPVILGGNCQGAYMAMKVADHLQKSGTGIVRFFMMEANITHPVGFPVSLIFGRESSMNPYHEGKNPELIWGERFASYTVDFINGRHGEFFTGDRVTELVSVIRKYLPVYD